MDLFRFALLGLASGAVFALVAQALVLVYRASGILNLAQGAFVMVGAYAYYQFATWGMPLPLAVLCSVLVSILLGMVVHGSAIAPLKRSSALTRIIATLGILLVLQSVAVLVYGVDFRRAPSWLPTDTVELVPGIPVGVDRYFIIAIGFLATVLLWAIYRYTNFGRVTSAVAENEQAAETLGHSAQRVATLNWGLGSGLAGFAGTLIGPIIYLEPTQLVLLVLPALAAAMVGGFSSFPIAFAAALCIGVAQGWLQRYLDNPAWATAVPFLVVIVWLVLRGRGLPLRNQLLDRMPAVGSGRVRPFVVGVLVITTTLIILFTMTDRWATAFTVTALMSIVCLSTVVITGYAGQLSLTQYILAGVAALIAVRVSERLPFELALVFAVLVTAGLGALIGLPSLKTRGATLAVVTLALADVLYRLVLDNPTTNGGTAGLLVDAPTLFGVNIDPLIYPQRYALVALLVVVVVSLALANLRRGVAGRRLIAVRSNERAATALGVGVYGAKLYAFTLAASLAALGGVLLAYQQSVVLTSQFAVFASLTLVGFTVAGGVGMIGGAFVGALMAPGGLGSQLLHDIPDINVYLPLAGGLILLFGLRIAPDGLFELNRHMLAKLLPRFFERTPASTVAPPHALEAMSTQKAVHPGVPTAPAQLVIDSLSVHFGGVRAVENVSLTVEPGQVHGLIGPNGAGKTTLIDAVTGFAQISGGAVHLGDRDTAAWSSRRRARSGIVRSFQSLELFADLTVRENIAVACDEGKRRRYLLDLVWPGRVRLDPQALHAIGLCGLGAYLDSKPHELPLGIRRLVAIARAIAAAPRVLLLDEPAAGLDNNEAEELGTLIRSVAESGVAVLLIEHRMDLIQSCCDVVTVMQSGKYLAGGTPSSVLQTAEVLDAYLGTRHTDHGPRAEHRRDSVSSNPSNNTHS